MTKEELIRNTIQALQAELKTKDTNLATLTNTVRQLTKDKQSLQDEKQSLQTQLQKKTQQDDENNQQKQRLGQKLQAQEQIILEGRKGNQTQATEIERLKQQINSNITFYTTRAEEHKQQIAKQQKEAQADKHRLHNYDLDKQFTHTIYKVVGWIVKSLP